MNKRTFLLNFSRLVIALILFTGLSVVPVTQAADSIIYVDADATEPNDGTSWTDAYTDLQDAISAAESTDEIWVAEGTYKPTAGIDQDISFQLKSGVAIYGGFTGVETTREERDSDPATNKTILSGEIGNLEETSDNSNTVVTSYKVTSTAVLDGFTITAGNANGKSGIPHPDKSGGGMHNNTSNPTLANLIFLDNQAYWGGGMFNFKSNPMVTNVVFSENTANTDGGGMYNKNSDPFVMYVEFAENIAIGDGGGIYNQGSNPVVDIGKFTENTASNGGGIYNDGSIPTLTNLTFFMNSASGDGGGVYNNSNAILINITFSGDTAGSGGGVYNNACNPTLTNITFAGETATLGGGMYNTNSSPVLTNLTFGGNTASLGGGIHNVSSNPLIQNSILWGNSDESGLIVSAQVYNNLSSPYISHSLVQGSYSSGAWDPNLGIDSGGNLDVNPLFVREPDDGGDGWDAGDDYGDLRLLADSPAINAGDNSLLPLDITDLDGDGNTSEPIPYDLYNNPRILNEIVDMGAFEDHEGHNESPTISGTLADQPVDDNATIDPFTAVTIADPDSDTLTVTITLDDAAKGNLTNLGGFVESPAGTYTLVGTPAAVTTATQSLTFDPTEDRVPVDESETTTFTITADDGIAAPVSDDTTTVIVTVVEKINTIYLPLIFR